MKQAIIVGSGAGGATAAKELQGKFHVTVLEAGRAFMPFPLSLSLVEVAKKAGLLFDEREVQLLFPYMQIRKTQDQVVVVFGSGLGGSTTLCAGNALRMDRGLRELGLDLGKEFEELDNEVPITRDHSARWRDATKRLFQICKEMGFDPKPLPKFGDYSKCRNCGMCVLGCRYGVKWDCRQFLAIAQSLGAKIVTGSRVTRVVIEDGTAKGVQATDRFYPADVVILAAGGLGTPVILKNSGIECLDRLFYDPVLCVAAQQRGSLQNKEIPMPFAAQREHYIISPYFDQLSYFFNRSWTYPASDILSLMIKLADLPAGSVDSKCIRKTLTPTDKERLRGAVETCKEILVRYGMKKETIFLGTLNAGHPGGMLPLTRDDAETLHSRRLPQNLYVADSTLLPQSLGNPPILTIMALAKRVSKVIAKQEG